jgi:hypothetical protein
MLRSILLRVAVFGASALLALAGCGGGSEKRADPARGWNFGTLAGYLTEDDVRSVGASWNVPAIREGSREGETGDWIGAQGLREHGFIQVGTIAKQTGSANLPESTHYFAFWTDQENRYRPVPLFEVTPLTQVVASLALAHGEWTVSIRDGPRSARFRTAGEGADRFRLAEWIAEDPGGRPHRVPFPVFTPVRFSALRLNGGVPDSADLGSQWLTAGHQHLGPTPVRGNAFEIVPVGPTAAGRQYLELADRLNEAARPVEERLVTAGESGGSSGFRAFVSARQTLAQEIDQFVQGLSGDRWPDTSRPALAALLRELRAQLALLRSQVGTGVAARRRWVTRWSAGEGFGTGAFGMRRALGLPQEHPEEGKCRLTPTSEWCAP